MTNHSFSQQAWHANSARYQQILELPFNCELAAGTLNTAAFREYMIQDAHYLEGFARALALLAAKGPDDESIIHFAEASQTAIVVERSLHADYFRHFAVSADDFANSERSPICDHYVSFLISTCAIQPFEVGLAAVLPCFWIYREVGHDIHRRAAAQNPYQAWIDTYAGADFDAAVQRVIAAADRCAQGTSAPVQHAMQEAFRRAVQLEWMFWQGAYDLQSWPL